MSQLWLPGIAGPQDELVRRIHGQIERFQDAHGLDSVEVSVELIDGSQHRLARLDAEPGFGFVTLSPVTETDDPAEIIVPVGAIKMLRIARAEAEQSFGFTPTGG
ncbi:MAG: hypothetical protein U0R50_11815 [Gaiellales bacterium]